jgi:hypothetical protein
MLRVHRDQAEPSARTQEQDMRYGFLIDTYAPTERPGV